MFTCAIMMVPVIACTSNIMLFHPWQLYQKCFMYIDSWILSNYYSFLPGKAILSSNVVRCLNVSFTDLCLPLWRIMIVFLQVPSFLNFFFVYLLIPAQGQMGSIKTSISELFIEKTLFHSKQLIFSFQTAYFKGKIVLLAIFLLAIRKSGKGFWVCWLLFALPSQKSARKSWNSVGHIRHGMTWCMMTSSNENIFRVTGPLCGEFTGHRWIPLTKSSDTELWCFLWSAPEQMVE